MSPELQAKVQAAIEAAVKEAKIKTAINAAVKDAKIKTALEAAVKEAWVHEFTLDETLQFIADALMNGSDEAVRAFQERHNQRIQSGRWRRP
jgi:hypothetical protein